MAKILEKLAQSLTAESVDLIPFLPYLLQDLFELGASPKDIESLLRQHVYLGNDFKVLDLACGKGAVTLHLAKQFKGYYKGIDLMETFIAEAKQFADQNGLSKCCTFVCEDIHQSVKKERLYDVVIYAAVGNVLGTYQEILHQLKETIKPKGYMVIDDVYINEENDATYLTKESWQKLLKSFNLRLVADIIIDDQELSELNKQQQLNIQNRAKELIIQYPKHKELFEAYIKSQQDECELLEKKVFGVTMLIQRLD